MKRIPNTIISISIFILSVFVLNTTAQENSDKVEFKAKAASPNSFSKNWFIGIKGGATFFLSPLKDNPFSWGASASLGKQLNRKIAIRADYLYGNLKSEGHFIKENDDGSFYKNDLKSNVDFMEISLIAKLSLNDFFYSHSPKHLREFYIFSGVAYNLYRTKITDTDDVFIMGNGYSDTGDQEAMETGLAIPIGLGITYKLDKADRINFNAEFGYRFEQATGLNGGLTDNSAQYTYTSLGLLFNLGKPTRSPQKITSDVVKDELEANINQQIANDIDHKIDEEIKPMKEDLEQQKEALTKNQAQLDLLQENMEARTNAIDEQLKSKTDNKSQSGSGINSVYFAFNSTYITSAMQREIARTATALKENQNLKCQIFGNSSDEGSPEYNEQLSQKRAEAVMSILITEFKIDEERLSIINNGSKDPLAENIKKINRRVDLIIN